MSSRQRKNIGRSDIGRPISARNMPDGSGVANSSWKSHSPRSMNPSMSSFTSARVGIERGHVLRREQRIEQTPVLHMVGWIDLERDELLLLPDVDRLRCRREHLGVAHRPHHVLVARHDRGWRAVPTVDARDRAFRADARVRRLWRVGRRGIEEQRCYVEGGQLLRGHGLVSCRWAGARPRPRWQNPQRYVASSSGSARPSATS